MPETRAELPQAQSPGPAAQQDTSRVPHSHPWGRDCPSHCPPSPTASSRCCGSRAQPLPSLRGSRVQWEKSPGQRGSSPAAAPERTASSQGRGASWHTWFWSSSPCVRPQGPGFCPSARSSPRCPPAPLPVLPGGTSLTPLPSGMLGEGLPQLRVGLCKDLRGSPSAQPARQHQRRGRCRYADTGARQPNATAGRLMRSSLQCSPQEKGHTRTRRAPNPPLLPARAKRGEKCPDPPPAPKTTGAPRAPPLHHGSSPLHQLIPTSFEPAHRKMIHIPRQALKSKEYQICSCPHNVTSGLRACVLHSE